jgi:hypothetical protein
MAAETRPLYECPVNIEVLKKGTVTHKDNQITYVLRPVANKLPVEVRHLSVVQGEQGIGSIERFSRRF